MRVAFTRAYGTNLKHIISRSTNNRVKAFFSGVGVTALLQSSTATTLITASFIKKSMITTAAALAVIIGADLSTTLIAQILTFDLSWLSPILIIIGTILRIKEQHGGKSKHLARASIGLGMMLLSLSMIREISEPLKHSDVLPLILAPLQNEPVLAILFATLFTWLVHSSLAVVLVFSSLAANHIVSLDLGLYLVLGANVGGALIAYAATYSDGAKVRRITTGNLFMRIATLIVCFPFLHFIAGHLLTLDPSPARQIVHFHTGFNFALALIFLPITNFVAQKLERFIPEPPKPTGEDAPLYLDEGQLDTPTIALAGASRETLRLADLVQQMLEQTMEAMIHGDSRLAQRARSTDKKVDSIYKEIKSYLTRLKHESLSSVESARYEQIITFATNLEHCGDIIEKSLIELVQKKIKKQTNFSHEGWLEIKDFHAHVLKNCQTAQSIFLSQSTDLATELIDEKKGLKHKELESSRKHFKRLRQGEPETIATSSLHLDILRDLRRVNSYITSVAYTILDTRPDNED